MPPTPPPSTSVPSCSRTFWNAFQMLVRPGVCLPKHVVMPERELEEAEAVGAAALRLGGVAMAGEAGDHGDVRVHRVADRHALPLEGLVVVVHPVLAPRRGR